MSSEQTTPFKAQQAIQDAIQNTLAEPFNGDADREKTNAIIQKLAEAVAPKIVPSEGVIDNLIPQLPDLLKMVAAIPSRGEGQHSIRIDDLVRESNSPLSIQVPIDGAIWDGSFDTTVGPNAFPWRLVKLGYMQRKLAELIGWDPTCVRINITASGLLAKSTVTVQLSVYGTGVQA
jgi:hypothetical protein